MNPYKEVTKVHSMRKAGAPRPWLTRGGVAAFGPMFAMSLLSLVPLFIVFFVFQRRLIEGIATTGLKG